MAPACAASLPARPVTDPAAEARLDALEMRVAHHEATIDDLNAALTAQWDRIDRLQREIALLREQLREAEVRTTTSVPPDPPPPHY